MIVKSSNHDGSAAAVGMQQDGDRRDAKTTRFICFANLTVSAHAVTLSHQMQGYGCGGNESLAGLISSKRQASEKQRGAAAKRRVRDPEIAAPRSSTSIGASDVRARGRGFVVRTSVAHSTV